MNKIDRRCFGQSGQDKFLKRKKSLEKDFFFQIFKIYESSEPSYQQRVHFPIGNMLIISSYCFVDIMILRLSNNLDNLVVQEWFNDFLFKFSLRFNSLDGLDLKEREIWKITKYSAKHSSRIDFETFKLTIFYFYLSYLSILLL